MAREIYVFGDWLELDEPQQIGTLRADVARGSEVLSFEYTDTWLARGLSLIHISEPTRPY